MPCQRTDWAAKAGRAASSTTPTARQSTATAAAIRISDVTLRDTTLRVRHANGLHVTVRYLLCSITCCRPLERERSRYHMRTRRSPTGCSTVARPALWSQRSWRTNGKGGSLRRRSRSHSCHEGGTDQTQVVGAARRGDGRRLARRRCGPRMALRSPRSTCCGRLALQGVPGHGGALQRSSRSTATTSSPSTSRAPTFSPHRSRRARRPTSSAGASTTYSTKLLTDAVGLSHEHAAPLLPRTSCA